MAEPTAYQRVGASALDVTEAGKKELWYLAFDGVDDFMLLGAGLTAISQTDNLLVAAARGGLSSIRQRLFQFSSSARTRLAIFYGNTNADDLSFTSSTFGNALISTAVPRESDIVITGSSVGTTSTLRTNGVQRAQSATASNNATDTVEVGRLTGTGDYLEGRVYGLLASSKTVDGGDISLSEQYLASKSGVTLP